MKEIRSGVYSPQVRQQYEARLVWAEKALQETGDELYKCGVETTEYFQVLDSHRRIEETLTKAKTALTNYRACTCGSGYIWAKCPGHPETGTMYCG